MVVLAIPAIVGGGVAIAAEILLLQLLPFLKKSDERIATNSITAPLNQLRNTTITVIMSTTGADDKDTPRPPRLQ